MKKAKSTKPQSDKKDQEDPKVKESQKEKEKQKSKKAQESDSEEDYYTERGQSVKEFRIDLTLSDFSENEAIKLIFICIYPKIVVLLQSQ